MLRNAGIGFRAIPARIDEQSIKATLSNEGLESREIADALAEAKARQISGRHPEYVVIGSDQVLDFQGTLLSKPTNTADARQQLCALRGKKHRLFSAAVIYQNHQPLWRFVGVGTLTMRDFSDAFLDGYLTRMGQDVCRTVGSYKLESEGIRLFSRVEGDYFSVLGMPLVEILAYLATSGKIET